MSGLPSGWEWDYDGARWFYRYKPNGHVQFHFPKEGDEFPDFIDNFSPAPDLAPEEKLESQQQVKRRTTLDTDPKSKMRATGGPLAAFGMNRSGFGGPLNNDEDDDGFFFQPENFMYLGPGAYTDVSPEADEDERDEIPKKADKSDGGQSNSKNNALLDATSERSGVSPLQSEANTPSVVNSVPVQQAAVAQELVAPEPPAEPPLIINTHDLPVSADAVAGSPGVPLLDSVEKPRQESTATFQPPPWDPVGIMAEMATEHTAPAHIEIHPDPVEMADNAVLAPIETRVADFGIAELPERTSPSDPKPSTQSTHELLHRTNMSDEAIYGATFGTGSRPQTSSQPHASRASSESRSGAVADESRSEGSLPRPALQQTQRQTQSPPADANDVTFAIKRKPSNSGPHHNKYQPYVPGLASSVASAQSSGEPDFSRRDHTNSLSREVSLMMGPRPRLDQTSMPSILQPPQVPPKVPIAAGQPLAPKVANLASPLRPQDGARVPSAVVGAIYAGNPSSQDILQHVPSVLKPARGQPQGRPQQASPPQPGSCQDPSTSKNSTSILSPPTEPTSQSAPEQARSDAARYVAFQPGFVNKESAQPSPATQFPAIPLSNRGPQPFLGYRPQVQRVETAPLQSPTDQQQPSSPRDRSSTRSAPALPNFLQRPRAQSDIRQQRGSYSQPQASEGHNPNEAVRGMQWSGPSSSSSRELARQTSYASSEVSSLGPPTGSQSSAPLQTPSPLESGGRRPSSGFFRGANTGFCSAQSATCHTGQNVPMHPAGSRPASFSGPSPTTQAESAKQPDLAARPSPPAVPQKIPISVSTGGFQQVTGQKTPGGSSTPASNRRHSLPPDSLATLGAQPSPQEASPRTYELSDQSHCQLPAGFDQVQWARSGDGRKDIAQNIRRPHSAHPPNTQTAKSVGMPPLSPQPPYPTGNDRQTAKPLSGRPSRPTVTPPLQYVYGPMSPSTPIRSPGHCLRPIQEHHENGNSMDRASAASAPRNHSEVRRYSQGSSLHLSSASSYPSSAESTRGYNAEKMMNQVAQQQLPGPSTVSQQRQQQQQPSINHTRLPPHTIYSPVAGNPFQQYSPISAGGSSLRNATRPESTPPVTQQPPSKDKDKGGWLSKFMKSANKPSVLQKPPLPPQNFPVAHSSPHAIIPPQGHSQQNRVDAGIPDQILEKRAIPLTVAGQKATSNFEQMSFVSSGLSTPSNDQSAGHSQGHVKHHGPLGQQDRLPPEKAPPTAGQQPHTPLTIHQPHDLEQQREHRPASVPAGGLALPVGTSKDQTVDNLSDAASVSTMDVSEAQAQPVLKPQLVNVERHTATPSEPKKDAPFGAGNLAQKSHLPSAVRHDDDTRAAVDNELTVAPLFSKPQTKTNVSTDLVNQPAVAQDKWAKKPPAVDYSGDDWGDDPWDYQ